MPEMSQIEKRKVALKIKFTGLFNQVGNRFQIRHERPTPHCSLVPPRRERFFLLEIRTLVDWFCHAIRQRRNTAPDHTGYGQNNAYRIGECPWDI